MSTLERVSANCYRIPKRGKMNTEALVYLNSSLYRAFEEDEAVKQLIDAASMPGVYGPVIGMPDIHSGFGLPIGGVMAFDASEGLISAGAVGMDINCGVRLLSTNLEASRLDKSTLRALIKAIVQRVPSGVGQKSKHAPLVKEHFRRFTERGVPFLLELGFGREEDAGCIEDGGSFPGANLDAVSSEAVRRGLQLSTIGGGNHFIELGYVDKTYDTAFAGKVGLEEGRLTVLIHTGSRGFGHQICVDFSSSMLKEASRLQMDLPSRGLAAVPLSSREGKRYLAAMACAINFAYCNRQWITDDVRKAFAQVLGGEDKDCGLDLVYDIAHNTAKFEAIKGKKLLIHRKGATRALPGGHPLNPPVYREEGHPVLIPGSMGSASYVIAGEPGVEKTFFSVNHGAGRVLSRSAARRRIDPEELKSTMGGILLLGRNFKAYLDEAPQAYKDIEAVVETFTGIGFTRKIARLLPLAVIKGEGRES